MQNKRWCKSIAIAILICQLLLTGCWDKIELENRGFVNAIGIDKFKPSEKKSNSSGKSKETSKDDIKKEDPAKEESDKQSKTEEESESEDAEEAEKTKDNQTIVFEGNPHQNRFTISMALPSLESLATGGSSETKNKSVKVAANETVSAAMRIIDSNSSQKLYFGHTKAAVFGENMLEDPQLFKEAMDALERNRELSRKLIILAIDGRAEDVLSENLNGEPLLGMFVSNFYKNNANTVALAFRQDLQHLVQQISSSDCAIIPKIELKDGELKLGGAAVMKDYKLAGWLNDKDTRGYLWLKAETEGAQVVIPYEDTYVPLRVYKSNNHLSFHESGGQIICNAEVEVKGSIEEFIFNNEALYDSETLKVLSKKFENTIEEEILATADCFQNKYEVDGFHLKNEIRKRAYTIYTKHENDWDTALKKIVIEPHVSVKVTSTGAIK